MRLCVCVAKNARAAVNAPCLRRRLMDRRRPRGARARFRRGGREWGASLARLSGGADDDEAAKGAENNRRNLALRAVEIRGAGDSCATAQFCAADYQSSANLRPPLSVCARARAHHSQLIVYLLCACVAAATAAAQSARASSIRRRPARAPLAPPTGGPLPARGRHSSAAETATSGGRRRDLPLASRTHLAAPS